MCQSVAVHQHTRGQQYFSLATNNAVLQRLQVECKLINLHMQLATYAEQLFSANM